ncbi:MAG: hypothetical protein CMN76_08130 [Spirochaetaceae bacterium]|nr:hypothetical protein [Spirochaetaceae bacterium]|tara:strand:+ start:33500 stop:35410 length:1911 start_codon:yes stop_codon:yes gene_type:complete
MVKPWIARSAFFLFILSVFTIHAEAPEVTNPDVGPDRNPGIEEPGTAPTETDIEAPTPNDRDSTNAPIESETPAPAETGTNEVQVPGAQSEAPKKESIETALPTPMESTGSLLSYVRSAEFRQVLEALGWSVLLVLTLLLSIWLITYVFQVIYSKLESLAAKLATGIKIRNSEIVQASTLQAVLRVTLRLLHLVLNIVLILFVADLIVELFPGAAGSATAAIIKSVVRALVATMVFVAVFRGVVYGFKFLQRSIPFLQNRFIPDLEFQNTVLLSRDRILGALQVAANVLRVLVLLLVVYFYLATIFGLFEPTKNWASLLLAYLKIPLVASAEAVLAYLPNLFFLVLVILVTRYSIKIAGFLFREVEKGTIEINGFFPDWARPTHKILNVVLIAFAAIIAFPYLPGAKSDAFKGISIFLGFMLSLGSSAIIANIMAGIVITYMRPFRVGDRVKIGETEGKILEKTLLVTRIRTVKNVEITIPNGTVLASHIINYSTAIAREDTEGLILDTTVTIGYDVPYTQVQELLIQAATIVPDVKADPPPFVLQTSLDDYYISYQINCYTDKPEDMPRIYSNLHQRILEKFNEAGVEIMSPHYYALRDGNQITLPEGNIPPGYRPGSFRWQNAGGADDPNREQS